MSDTTPAQASTASRRRSSATSQFANLMNQKRGSMDEAATARRASIHDQYQQKGMFGQMWHNFTKGATTEQPKQEAPGQMGKQSIHRTGAGTLG